MAERRIRYLLAFQDAPWRDGEELIAATALNIGEHVSVAAADGTTEIWAVGDIWRAPEEQAEVLQLFRP